MRRLWALLAVMGLLAAFCPAAEAAGSCGPKPRLHPVLHRIMYKAQNLMDKEPARAAGILQDFAKNEPGFKHFRFSSFRGILAYKQGRLDDADRLFAEAVKLRPCYAEGLMNLALVRYEKKKPLEAAELMLKAYRLSRPPKPKILYEAAVLYLAGDRPNKALPLLQTLANIPKPAKQWLKALFNAHLQLKQTARAKKVLDRLLRLDPEDADLWRISASLELERKHYRAAAAALEVAYRLRPASFSDWRTLGSIYRAAKIPLKALECYRRVYGESPTAKQLDTLARLFLQANDLKQALDAAQKAKDSKPTPQRAAMVGQIFLQKKKYVSAFDAFDRAARLAGKKGGRYSLMAGYCAWQMEDLPKASRALARAVKLAPPASALAKEASQSLTSVQEHLRNKEQTRRRGG